MIDEAQLCLPACLPARLPACHNCGNMLLLFAESLLLLVLTGGSGSNLP